MDARIITISRNIGGRCAEQHDAYRVEWRQIEAKELMAKATSQQADTHPNMKDCSLFMKSIRIKAWDRWVPCNQFGGQGVQQPKSKQFCANG